MHGHVLICHIRRQFVLQAVNVNKNAVEFFFVLFELQKAVFAFLLPSSIFLGNQFSHINYSSDSLVNVLPIRSQVSRKLVLSWSQVEGKNTFEIDDESFDDKPSRSTGFAFADHFSVFLEFPHQHLNLIAVETRQNLLQFFERSSNFVVLADVL